MKRILILLFVFCLVLALMACEGEMDNKGKTKTSDIAVCLASEPITIDPALNYTVDGAIMLQHAFEGLLKWVDDGNGNATLVPGMAESWDVSEDSLTYTFNIREGALWSDGQPVTAYDFEYAWKRLVEPKTGADYSYILDCVLNAIEISDGELDSSKLAAVALDDSTFEVTLHTAIPYFTKIVAFPATFPVREDIVEEHGDQWIYAPETYVNNGPYVMSEWVHNSYIKMKVNNNYYDVENLGPDSIKFALMKDSNAILTAFNSGELDFAKNLPVTEAPRLLETGRLKVADYIGTYYVSFQTELEPFDEPLVREAFSLAIDRSYIVSQVTGTGEVPASAYVPYGLYDAEGPGTDFREVGGEYFSVDKDDYETNCERARELLSEAGYPEGKEFPNVEFSYYTDDRHTAIGKTLRNMWQNELGITVTLNDIKREDFLEKNKDGEFPIALNGWIVDYNDPISFFDMWITGNGNNDTKYTNLDYDKLVMEAKTSKDAPVRMQAMHSAEDILIGEHVVAPIYFLTQPYMIADNLKGVYYTPLGYFFFGYSYR